MADPMIDSEKSKGIDGGENCPIGSRKEDSDHDPFIGRPLIGAGHPDHSWVPYAITVQGLKCNNPKQGRVEQIKMSQPLVILATASYDHSIRFWEAKSGRYYRTIQYPDSKSHASHGCKTGITKGWKFFSRTFPGVLYSSVILPNLPNMGFMRLLKRCLLVSRQMVLDTVP